MTNRKTSAVWLHFDDEDGLRAKCRHCDATLSLSGGCHSNLKRHLRAKHSLTSSKLENLVVPPTPTTIESMIKFEESVDEQSLDSTEVKMVAEQQETGQFIRRPSPNHKVVRKKRKRVYTNGIQKRKYSVIWIHFEDEGGQKATCKYCKATLSFYGGCHGNLRRHMRLKHPHMPLNIVKPVVVPKNEEMTTFEDSDDDDDGQSLDSTTDMGTISQQQHHKTPKVKKENDENDKNTQKKKYSVIWLHFDDVNGQRAKCKYCRATLSFFGGCHGNLRRHMRVKHPEIVLNVEDQLPILEERANAEEFVDEDPLDSGQIRMITEDYQTNEYFSEPPQVRKIEHMTRKGKRVYYRTIPKVKYSAVWSHFDDDGHHRARCMHCETTISIAGGCHGNLSRHLRLKHPNISLNKTIKFKKSQKLMNLDDLIEQPKINIKTTNDEIDRQLLKMLAKGHHSFRLLEEPEFQKLIHDVSNCPGYTLPSIKTLSTGLLPQIYEDLLEDIKRKMQSATAVCLTTDSWTSSTNVICLTVTAHYINSETELMSHLLAYEEFENNYTTENLTNFLQNVISNFDINEVTAIVSSDEPNIVAAVELQGEWQRISCFGHALNLTLQAATAEISEIIVKVKKIVEYFSKNSEALKELQIAQNQMNLPNLKLKQDVPKRWNSTFEMLQRINQIKEAVATTILLNQPELMLNTEDWEIIAETISILRPFYEVTMEISQEKNFTLSKVTVLYNLLDKYIAKCQPSSDEVTAMVINIQMGTASCFGNLEKNELYAESTILDPRFKQKGFRNEASYQEALINIRHKICNIKLPSVEEETLGTIEDERLSLWEAYDSEFNKTASPIDNTAACVRELDKYMNEEYLDRRKNPLVWWEERKHLYPRLYMCVIKRLCIVASSIPCDRIFSAAGQMLSERRTLLEASKIERQIFLHTNM